MPVDVADDTLPASGSADGLAQTPAALSACLSENTVLAFLYGQAGKQQCERIDGHIDQCSLCAQLVAGAAHADAPPAPDSVQRTWQPTAFEKGSLLAGRFTILRFVARGGMGEVYEAFDEKVPGRVALKTMLCTMSDSASAVQRLCEEVKLARRIAHRNVCRIHELHEHRDDAHGHPPLYFLAMEFVDGRTLKETLREGRLPIAEVGSIARQLLLGLGAAHDAGVLHLDFKSQNVMLRDTGRSREALIMDFSLSRAFETEARLAASERQIAGTPGYISPEQFECLTTLGPPSDIYSFGVVLFEMLTGRLPFEGKGAMSVWGKQRAASAPRPSAIRAELPSAFDRFVMKCLHPDANERFADTVSALAALDECLASLQAAPRKRHRSAPLVGALAAAVGLVAAIGIARHDFDGRAEAPAPSEPPSIVTRAIPLEPEPAARQKPGSESQPAPPGASSLGTTADATAGSATVAASAEPERPRENPSRLAPPAARESRGRRAISRRPAPAAHVARGRAPEPSREPKPWTPRYAPPRLY